MKLINLKKHFKDPPILKNWGIYDKCELDDIIKNKKLKLLYFQTSALCNLGCIYCPTKSGKKSKKELSIHERKKIINDFYELGGEIIHYIGEGEPLIDPFFWEDYEVIKKLGLKIVVFTHGGNIDEKIVIKLKEIDASVIIKYHSHNNKIQDLLANKKGYSDKRDKALQLFIKHGFNKGSETRLGLDILVMKTNYNSIEDYWRFCRTNNIFPMVKKIFFSESASLQQIKDSLDVGTNKVKELFYRLSYIDRTKYGYFWIPSPPWAAIKCNYYYYHIFITNKGNVRPCIGIRDIGNIKDNSLKYFWESSIMDEIRSVPETIGGTCKTCVNNIIDNCYGCPCRKVFHHGEEKVEDIFKGNNCFSSCGI